MRLLATLACLLTGCGASHAPDAGERDAGRDAAPATDATIDGGGGEPGCLPCASDADIEGFLEWTRRLYCETAAACDEGLVWPDLATCMRYDSVAWMEPWGSTLRLLRDGSMVLDPDGLAECLVRPSPCEHGQTLHERTGFWLRTEPDGFCDILLPRCEDSAVCRNGECDADQQCELDLAACGESRCVPALPAGAECLIPTECALTPGADAAACLPAGAGEPSRCARVHLLAPVGEGAACGPIASEGDEVQLLPCEVGLGCVARDRETPLVRECWRGPGAGERCDPVDTVKGLRSCRRGLVCSVEDTTCVAPAPIDPVYVGEPCETDEDRAQCEIQRWSECIGGACVEAGRALGQPCDETHQWSSVRYGPTLGGPECPLDAFCDRSPALDTPVCAPRLPNGRECRDDGVCSSRCCDRDAQRCVEATVENGCLWEPCSAAPSACD